MLTEAAFNALLKTLEEPPPHIVFILATTEVHKVLPTIVSRCQRFDFLSLKVGDIVSRLEKLSQDEGIETDTDTLLKVAQASSGSLRDAENILERLILTYGVRLDSKIVKNALDIGYESESIKYIISGDTKKSLEVLHTMEIGGSNLRFVHKMLLEYIRLVMHAKTGAIIKSALADERIRTIQKMGEQYSLPRILHCFNRLLEINFSRDLMDILPFELGIVEASVQISNEVFSQKKDIKDLSDTQIKEKDNLETNVSKLVDNRIPTKDQASVFNNGNSPSVVTNQDGSKNSDSSIQLTLSKWTEILDFLRLRKGKRFNLSALLRVSVAQRIEKDSLIITYKHPSHRDRLNTEIDDVAIRKVLEDAFEQFLGEKYTIQLEVQESLVTVDREKSLVDAAVELGAVIIEEVDHRSIKNDNKE